MGGARHLRHGALDGFGNVVELQIEEDVLALVDQFADELHSGGGVEFQPDFVEVARDGAQARDNEWSELRSADSTIESDDDAGFVSYECGSAFRGARQDAADAVGAGERALQRRGIGFGQRDQQAAGGLRVVEQVLRFRAGISAARSTAQEANSRLLCRPPGSAPWRGILRARRAGSGTLVDGDLQRDVAGQRHLARVADAARSR